MQQTKSQPKSWQRVKLKDITEKIASGGTPSRLHPEYFTSDREGNLWVKSKELLDVAIEDTEEKITDDALNNSSAKYFPEHTVLIAMYGANVGQLGWLKKRATVNQAVCGLIIDDSKANWRYVFYSLLQNRDDLIVQARGAAQQNLNQDLIKNFEIVILELESQRMVGSILAAYDDLIENNTKRIKILEQIAQAIYREWFVKPISNGELPNGWEASTLGEHLTGLESGSRPKGGVGEIKEGVPSVGAENINGIGRHDHNSEKYIAKEFFGKMKRGMVQNRDVALYKDGAYIGRSSYFRDGFPHKNFSVNEHVFLLRSSGERITQNFLYLWLREPDTIHEIRATNANAAQPGINQPGVRGLKIILPPQKVVKEFDIKVEPILASIINLAKQNNELRQARDLLLPKLVTGEIQV